MVLQPVRTQYKNCIRADGPWPLLILGKVFTIVSALWGQVVYRSLQLFPWRLMSRGTVSASESVLLDYISLWNVSALVKSLKRRHAMVSVPIAVSLVIKVMTVISTGLFMTENVQSELEKEFKAQKVFDGNAFNQSGMDSRVYLKTWGVAQHNLSNPAGTTKGHAFQNFFYDTGEGEYSSISTPIGIGFDFCAARGNAYIFAEHNIPGYCSCVYAVARMSRGIRENICR